MDAEYEGGISSIDDIRDDGMMRGAATMTRPGPRGGRAGRGTSYILRIENEMSCDPNFFFDIVLLAFC